MFVPFQVIKFLFIIFFKMVAFSFSWKSLRFIGWVATKPTADWNRIVYRAICKCLRPPISCVGGVILNQRRWYRRFKRGVKTIEIQLCRKEDPDPVTFTHMVLHPGRALMRQGIRKNLLGRLRQTLGPFISAREAWESVGGGRGLGMGLKQLEVFMTRPRMGKDGKLCDRVVPVILHCLEGVTETKDVEWINGHGNQAGLRRHQYQSKHDPLGCLTSLFRYRNESASVGCASAVAPPAVPASPAVVHSAPAACDVARETSAQSRSVPRRSGWLGLRRLGQPCGSRKLLQQQMTSARRLL